ncbi:MAG: hypothetical protein A4E65_00057 [Syntrophorhabdus sp. PtaU1.Bin153]|nr:MAG: hypothetical protein A4E65_00057 [Syntrophorhabdus sp. PtaU1.Bin153]
MNNVQRSYNLLKLIQNMKSREIEEITSNL